MNMQLLYCLMLGGCFLALFATGEFLYRVLKVQAEYTRKLIHIGTGLLTLLFPLLLENHWYVLLLCGMFAIILLLSLRFKFLPSINAIDRKSHGSISYPLAVYCTFLFYAYGYSENGMHVAQPPFYYIPVLTLAICDPLAALFGKRFPYKPFKVGEGKKTVSGSLAFFSSAMLLCFSILFVCCSSYPLVNALLISFIVAFTTTVAEAFSRNGFDNLTIPGAAILALYLLTHFTTLYHPYCV